MADNTLAFSIKIDGVDREIKSLKDLKQAKKDATDAFLKGDKDAAKAIADLKDKTEDLTDATQTLKGSGVEKLTSSFSQLKDGFASFDGEKISTAFKGIGSAMKAIPLLLIVEGIRYLVENFDELSKGSGLLAKALQFVGSIITSVKDAINDFTDSIGLTNTALDKLGESTVENANKSKDALANQTAEYDRQIAVAKANGKSAVDLEIAKQQAIIDTNKALVEQTIAYVRQGGVLNDEQKKLLTEQLNSIKNAVTNQQVIEIGHTKALKDENDKRLADHKKLLEDKAKEDLDAWNLTLQIRQQNADAQKKDDERLEKERLEAKKLADEEWLKQTKVSLEEEQAFKIDNAEFDRKLVELTEAQKIDISRNSIQSVQQLTDLFFMFKSQKAKKGSKEEEDLARKQFNLNKGLQLGLAVIDGFKSITSSLAQSPIAVGVVPNPIGIASLAFASITAATNIAKIAAAKFQPTGGGGGGDAAAVPIPAPPTINTPNANTNSNTTFDENGKRIGEGEKSGQPTINVKATVGVDEVSSKTNRVETLEKQSTF